jgi:hypothetical protein
MKPAVAEPVSSATSGERQDRAPRKLRASARHQHLDMAEAKRAAAPPLDQPDEQPAQKDADRGDPREITDRERATDEGRERATQGEEFGRERGERVEATEECEGDQARKREPQEVARCAAGKATADARAAMAVQKGMEAGDGEDEEERGDQGCRVAATLRMSCRN